MLPKDSTEQIAAKQAEVTNYERVLKAYAARGGGCLYDQSARHLVVLRDELSALQAAGPPMITSTGASAT